MVGIEARGGVGRHGEAVDKGLAGVDEREDVILQGRGSGVSPQNKLPL